LPSRRETKPTLFGRLDGRRRGLQKLLLTRNRLRLGGLLAEKPRLRKRNILGLLSAGTREKQLLLQLKRTRIGSLRGLRTLAELTRKLGLLCEQRNTLRRLADNRIVRVGRRETAAKLEVILEKSRLDVVHFIEVTVKIGTTEVGSEGGVKISGCKRVAATKRGFSPRYKRRKSSRRDLYTKKRSSLRS
jgi:hypothetical protein